MEILDTLIYMLNEMSPYILLGFLIAGVLHSFVPPRLMSRHLAGTGPRAVIKAAMVGVPLPLCSCGVLPTAVSLRRSGASRAASTSFLIATPQTGVDSIAATWSMLGPAFAVVRPVAALVTAFAGGLAVGAKETPGESGMDPADPSSPQTNPRPLPVGRRVADALVYGFHTMVQSIGGWLVAGLVIAALITILVPADFFAALGRYPILAMAAVLVVAVPMYVCATGSIPIAMSLILKGLSPGTALVLLMAGPAVNFASIAIVSRTMGRQSAFTYMGAIVAGAVIFGLVTDYLLPASWFALPPIHYGADCHEGLPWFSTVCSAILCILLAIAFIPRLFNRKKISKMSVQYKIQGMSCPHCKATVEKNLATIDGVTAVTVDLGKGIAAVDGPHDRDAVIAKIREIGFEPII